MTTLVGLQEEYRAWLDNLPANLQGSLLADKLPSSISRSCKASIHRAVTAATVN
jgi:hypothetical protein